MICDIICPAKLLNIHFLLKSKAFLYTNNQISEKKILNKIPFTIATRKVKYPGINLTKELKDPYSENYTTLKKEIKEDANGSMYHVHG